jgi:hypothetical protein
MKRMLVTLMMLSLLAVPAAYAAESAGGCGLGQQAFEGQTGLGPHLIAGILNAFTSNTSSLTTGTFGCDADAVIKAEHEAQFFVAWNMPRVSEDMARGDGEYLHSLASLMGCDAAYGEFASMTQEKYSELVDGANTPDQFLGNLKREISARPALSTACTRVS